MTKKNINAKDLVYLKLIHVLRISTNGGSTYMRFYCWSYSSTNSSKTSKTYWI